jgi:hypothetical protein
MRVRLALCLMMLAACGGDPQTTGLVVKVEYLASSIDRLAVSGFTSMSARRFGPYQLTQKQLPSGATVGFVFDPTDAGQATICAEAWGATADLISASACATFDVHAYAIGNGTLQLKENASPPPSPPPARSPDHGDSQE